MRQRTISDLTYPDDLDADLAGMSRLVRGELATYLIDKRYLTASGAIVWVQKSASLMRNENGAPSHFIAQVQDITERKAIELALADERRQLRDAELIGRMGRAGGAPVDDPADTADRALGRTVAERITVALQAPIVFHDVEHLVSVSIGIAYGGLSVAGSESAALGTPTAADTRPRTADELLQNADAAMYRAKRLGKDRHEVFEEGMRADLNKRARVEQALRSALRAEDNPGAPTRSRPACELTAHYQPIFDSGTGALVGFEALARLTDADAASVPPDVFIGIAEDTGLIRPVGTAMLALALRQLATWRATVRGLEDVTMAVNVSALQAQHATLDRDVRRALHTAGLRPDALVLELTESALLQASQLTIETLRALHHEGMGIAIDDFGTGYASLRYLATLPVSAVKVDRSFTAGVSLDGTDRKIVFAVAGLAADMNLACVIEGVETEAQRGALPAGVQLQGYLTGRPQPPAALDVAGLIRHGAPGG